jgi:hypothetical protein
MKSDQDHADNVSRVTCRSMKNAFLIISKTVGLAEKKSKLGIRCAFKFSQQRSFETFFDSINVYLVIRKSRSRYAQK